MKERNSEYFKLALTLFTAAALAILFNFFLTNLNNVGNAFNTLLGVLTPFIIGGVIAYILTPICNKLESSLAKALSSKKNGTKIAGSLSIILSLIIGIVVIVVLLLLVIPALVESIQALLLQLPSSIEEIQDWALALVGDNETLVNYINNLTEDITTDLPTWLVNNVLPYLETLIGGVSAGVVGVFNVVYNLIIGLIVSIYCLGNRKTFARQGNKLIHCIFKKSWADTIMDEFRYANKMFSSFISGRLLDSLIIGVICFVGMLILQIPNTVLVSVIVGVTNIIPFFGPWLGAIPSFLLILISSPGKAIIFLVLILVLQQFDGNFLGPKILGDKTGLSSFWVLFSILVFGGLFGFIGMIVGVPVFAVIYDIVCKLVNKGLAYRQKQETESQ